MMGKKIICSFCHRGQGTEQQLYIAGDLYIRSQEGCPCCWSSEALGLTAESPSLKVFERRLGNRALVGTAYSEAVQEFGYGDPRDLFHPCCSKTSEANLSSTCV